MAEKLSKIVLIALLVVGAASFIGSMFFEQYNFMIYLCYAYTFVGVLGGVAAFVMGAMSKPEAIKATIIGVVGMGVMLGISYALASGEILKVYPEGTTESSVKWSDTGLIMLYIIGTLSIISVIYSGVAQLLNKD
ncbi:MAG: hypothetical protein ACKVJP_02155 [Flavobacteriales bacterium]|tara:strand:- start:520 stop:924 length:405 start_codon:yes stop_codon:yes gene_type:complete